MGYRLAARWWRCLDPECDVLWDDPCPVPCWACGGVGAAANRPVITSGVIVPISA